jgi:hypothetical protein
MGPPGWKTDDRSDTESEQGYSNFFRRPVGPHQQTVVRSLSRNARGIGRVMRAGVSRKEPSMAKKKKKAAKKVAKKKKARK